MNSRSALVLRLGVAVVVAALLAGAAGVFLAGNGSKAVTAYFEETPGLYVGNSVRVLGVEVGEVTEIDPQGTRVRVEMSYTAERKVPADAQAVIIQPTLLTGRYVQLAPVYRGGPVLPDGATIPLSRTETPVGIDETYDTLNRLAAALGPEGANKNGALSHLLEVTANNLQGQGDDVHQTVEEVSKAVDTLAGSRRDLFATVRHLQKFTTALAENDQRVEAFNRDLAEVSAQLANDRQELGTALERLSVALGKVEAFVRENRDELAANVDNLAKVTESVVREKKSLAELLETAGLGLTNLALAYGAQSGTLRVRANIQQVQRPGMYICSLAYSLGLPPEECEPLLAPLETLRMRHLPFGVDPSGLPLVGRRDGPAETEAGSGRPPERPPEQPASPRGSEPDSTLGELLPGGGR